MRELRHLGDNHEQREQSERQIHVKHPAPARHRMTQQRYRSMIGEESADQRAGDTGKTEYAAEHSHQLAALARRIQIGNDCKGRGKQSSPAGALNGAKNHQLQHAAAEQRQLCEFSG